MLSFSSPVSTLGPIATKLAPVLKKLGIESVEHLLYHSPSRYVDLTNISPIKNLVPGDFATIQGTIVSVKDIHTKWKRLLITEAVVKDETGLISCVWFHQRFLTKTLLAGDTFLFTGKVELDEHGFKFTHPEYEKILPGKELIHGGRIVPLYPLTQRLTHKTLRFLIKTALQKTNIPEWLPSSIRSSCGLVGLKTALANIHFPANEALRSQAEHRLKFDELFLLLLRNARARKELSEKKAPTIEFHEDETRAYVSSIPFTLTQSQKFASWEIVKDITKPRPMNRLLSGDVGSGKTVVSSIPILNALLSGFQVAYMAPTEILAEQQFKTFCKLFEKQGFNIGLITSSGVSTNSLSSVIPLNSPAGELSDRESKNKKQTTVIANGRTSWEEVVERSVAISSDAQKGIASRNARNDSALLSRSSFLRLTANGTINFIVGTHSLIQKDVEFKNLGLVVVDEQHRFGVNQRAELIKKEVSGITYQVSSQEPIIRDTKYLIPHFLSMTATPIPRTLALTVYGDLDISVINEMPCDRKPIATKFIAHEKRTDMYRHVEQEISNGRQAFVVCPLIDPSDVLGVKSANEELEKIKKIFPALKVGILHGRQSAKQKNEVMKKFLEVQFDILVSTPVVEVGIDVQNASIMIIESAERFGLAQLHQLRGRVGRSEHQSTCYLLSDSESEATKKRLSAVIGSTNGLALAEQDLELRGPGDPYGLKQSGYEDTLYIARLTDFPVIQEAKKAAEQLLTQDPDLDHAYAVKKKVEERERKIHPE